MTSDTSTSDSSTHNTSPSDASRLQTYDLSVGFHQHSILQNVTVQLNPGEIIAIVGPNGAGKSTLIKTLARQLKPIAGSVKLNDADIWTLSSQTFATKVAYVPQDIEAGTELSVEQMVLLGRNPHQKWWQWYGDTADSAAVDKALKDTEMVKLRTKPICELSGGERQRAALATALAQEPLFMLLDEPTSHLDFKHQLELLELLKRLRLQGIGIMLVLHDLNVIARIADSVILIESPPEAPSQVASIGTVREALSRDNLLRVFEIDVATIDDHVTGEVIYNPFSLAPKTEKNNY